jgi:hypothetical protein
MQNEKTAIREHCPNLAAAGLRQRRASRQRRTRHLKLGHRPFASRLAIFHSSFYTLPLESYV